MSVDEPGEATTTAAHYASRDLEAAAKVADRFG
jgi:hypothetical protein